MLRPLKCLVLVALGASSLVQSHEFTLSQTRKRNRSSSNRFYIKLSVRSNLNDITWKREMGFLEHSNISLPIKNSRREMELNSKNLPISLVSNEVIELPEGPLTGGQWVRSINGVCRCFSSFGGRNCGIRC